tara:strand:- start:7056 stop:7184 length:129 start_codon:yes stop_codon:yes gene_type:complete
MGENYTQWRQVNKQMLDNSEGKLLFILLGGSLIAVIHQTLLN